MVYLCYSSGMSSVWERLQKVWEAAPHESGGELLPVYAGLETRTDPAEYVWDGLKRGVDPAHPFVIFQYTLAGVGEYAADGIKHRLTPGRAFAAVIPSAHVYRLPPDSAEWTFFYLFIRHPYAVQRLSAAQVEAGPTLTLAENDPLTTRAMTLFESVASRAFRDPWARELSLFDFVFEYERLLQRLRYPEVERETLLAEVRRQVLARPGGCDVETLAAGRGLSRSRFSHQFKAVTGLPPARWVRQVQLEDAARRLLDSPDKLETVARASGFANANHLCKVFRRFYHLSPAEFRRQMK